MNDVATPEHKAAAQVIRRVLAAYAEHEDLISIGAYRRGSNRTVDAAVEMREAIEELFRQPIETALARDEVIAQLVKLASQCQARMAAPVTPVQPAIAAQAAALAAASAG
jgi:flagellum-specific ATP synthase